jgi:ubiquinol-cytochrome c reductase cytochrome c subunit
VLRRLLRNRFLLPTAVLLAVGFGGVLGLASGASAQSSTTTTTTTVTLTPKTGATVPGTATSSTAAASATTSATGGLGSTLKKTVKSALSCKKESDQVSYPGPPNSGSPKGSTYVHCVDGHIVSYGNSAVTYKALPKSYIAAGETLFEQNCSSCHEADAQGGTAAPSLIGLGPATIDFWVSTGRMPAATPLKVQAQSGPVRFTTLKTHEIAAFVTSLSPAAPFIPTVHLKSANLATGASLFALNCAACHTITGMGDELAYGTNAPSLHKATATQVAEAIRTGPANMPRFTGNLSDGQVRDIVAYVTEKIQHPSNPGGFGLGGIGPVAEGFVALLFGVGGFMLICFWIGDRS